tara:strand:+ start:313 stop:1575 length:1263 start_codon:yes stop_codon:yes gene_type:complete
VDQGGFNKGLNRFAMFVVFATLCLIGMGGLVTSREAGLAVHDWPTSFGYNMFLLPLDQWLGKFGIFEEHSHRLLASLVGLLTAGLAGWLWVRESTGHKRKMALAGIVLTLGLMGVRTPSTFVAMALLAVVIAGISVWHIYQDRTALRWWGTLAYSMVIIQGVLGGLRVTQFNDEIGIFHGILAQLFLIVLVCIAVFSSLWWKITPTSSGAGEMAPKVIRFHFIAATAAILLQLILGATMRHQHAGLAVWDFPKAHGQWWPATDAASMQQYRSDRATLQKNLNEQKRVTDAEGRPMIFLSTGRDLQAGHVILHMLHRVGALLILGLVLCTVVLAHKRLGGSHCLSRLSLVWLALIVVQGILGALTVLKYKPADIATAHVVCGALSLLTGVIATIISHAKCLPPATRENSQGIAMARVEAIG